MVFPTEKELQQTFSVAEDAVYFATSDGKNKYYGFGKQAERVGASFLQVADWLANNADNMPIFGGFRFDGQVTANSQLMNGYFIQPVTLYDVANQSVIGEPIQMATGQTASALKILTQTDEEDWPVRIQVAIDDMKQNAEHEKVVLGRQREIEIVGELNQLALFDYLQTAQATSYHFVLKRSGELFVSATPERLVKVTNGSLETAAVAGTIKRGIDAAADQALADELWHDPKNRKEHQTVVATIKNQLQAAKVAHLVVPNEPQIMKNPQIQHLYTPINGILAENTSLLTLAAQLHPTPALGGQPQTWALSKIGTIEQKPRGLFGGPIGMIWPNGDGELIVGIRAMWYHDQLATLFAGAGILGDSDAKMEYQETNLKMLPMMNLLKEQGQHD